MRRFDVHEIGLDDRRVAQDAVDGRNEDFVETMLLDVLPKQREKPTDEPLVRGTGRGGHDQLAVVQLVAAAVSWKRLVVAVGKDDSSRRGFHVDKSSTHALIARG